MKSRWSLRRRLAGIVAGLGAAFVAGVGVTPGVSHASLSSYTQLCWRSDGSVDLFQYCAFDGGGDTTTSNVVESTLNPATSANQVFSATSFAAAAPDQWKVSLTVGVTDYRRDMYIWSEHVPPDDSTTIATTGVAGAVSTDTITVSGGSGVYSLSYIFSVEGSFATTNPDLFQPQFCASVYLPQGVGTATFHCLTPNAGSFSNFTLTYAELPFGGPVTATLSINAYGNIAALFPEEVDDFGADLMSGEMSASFGSTVHLESLLITDAQGNPIPGITVSSGSGFVYPLDPRNQGERVSEPGWLGLLGLALALTATRRRSHQPAT